MRLILMLTALLLVGLLLYRQLGDVQDSPAITPTSDTHLEVPRVPQRVQDVPAFEQQMQNFMLETSEERRRQIDALER